jgi:ribosomal protein L3 glutamine methyltransferase
MAKCKPAGCTTLSCAEFWGRHLAVTLESLIGRIANQLDRAGLFFGHGTDNAMDEAHWLVLHLAGIPVDQPVEDYSRPIPDDVIEAIDKLLAQRITKRCPLAYLINSAWFAGLEFYIDQRVLVPRSPIAELLLYGFHDRLDSRRINRVLDLCSGSGCIAIACAHAFPDAQIVASDVSRDALDVAAINTRHHGLNGRVTLLESNVFERVGGKYDLIISNPPYVDWQDMAQLHAEFKHEPAIGLAAGRDGLTIVDTILREASRYLSRDGRLVVEVGNSAAALEKKYPQLPFYWFEFERGGSGVFLLNANDLQQYQF